MSLQRMALALALFVFIQALAWVLDGRQEIDALAQARASVALLKDRYIERKKLAVNLDLYRDQLREADRLFGRLLYELPNKGDGTFAEVKLAALARGLCVELLRPEESEQFPSPAPSVRRRSSSPGRFTPWPPSSRI